MLRLGGKRRIAKNNCTNIATGHWIGKEIEFQSIQRRQHVRRSIAWRWQLLGFGSCFVSIERCRRGMARLCGWRSEKHTSELQSRFDLVCRLLLERQISI